MQKIHPKPCNVPLQLIFEYVDGELSPLDRAGFERHRARCENCRSRLELALRMRADVVDDLSTDVPPGLGQRVSAALERELNQERLAGYRMRQVPRQRFGQFRSLVRYAAVAVLTAGLTFAASLAFFAWPDQKAEIAQEAASAYRRAQLQDSAVALAESDGGQLRQWFEQRSLAIPLAQSFPDEGFSLRGGRLDFVDEKKVAALVYGHGSRHIDVFVWPEAHAERAAEFKSSQDLNIAYWFKNGLEFWAVSDDSKENLQRLSTLMMTNG